jgi:hypothetical protein
MQPRPLLHQPLGRDRTGLPVPAAVDVDADRITRRNQRGHVRISLEQIRLGGHQIGLGDTHRRFRATLGLGIKGHTRRHLHPVIPTGGHDLRMAHGDPGDVLHGDGLLVIGQRIRRRPSQPTQRRIHTRQQRRQSTIPGRDHHPKPRPGQPQTEQQRRPRLPARPRHHRAHTPVELTPHPRLGDPRPIRPPMPSPPPRLRLRDRTPGGALIPVEPDRDQPLVDHIRADMPPRTVHPLLDLAHKRIDQPRPPHRARHRQTPIPPLNMAAHRLRITPDQPRGRVRAPGQVERLKNLHHFPVILLHRSLHEPRVQRQPGVHRRRDHP